MKLLVSSHSLLISVVKALVGKFDVLALDRNMNQTLVNLDIESKALGDFAAPSMPAIAFTEAAKVLNSSFSPMSFNGLGPGPSKFLEEGLQGFLYPRLADLALLVLSLDKAEPDLVVLHNDVENLTRTVALWCQKRGVPCLHVPHAVYQNVNRGAVGTDIHDIITASHLAASGTYQRKWYEDRGQENIRETGLPQFDAWAVMEPDKKRALRLLHLDSDRPVITFMGTWRQNTNLLGHSDEWAMLYINFLKAIKMFGDEVQLIVKIHPNGGDQSAKFHASNAEQVGVNCVIAAQHLEVALQASDVVFAPYGSNSLIEAAYIPYTRLATFEHHGYFDDKEVMKSGFSEKEIAETLEESLSVEPADTKAFISKYAGIADGKAHLRVAGYAEELVM